MCGLFFSNTTPQALDSYIKNVDKFIRHRGILEPTYKLIDGMLFEHSLLPVQGSIPIIQPIVSENNVLVFSGELWKHDGYESDTLFLFDSLANSSDVTSIISQLHGMFGFVFYDRKRSKIYFATDIFGEIPLYYFQDFDQLIVVSEIKQIASLGLPIKKIKPSIPGCLYSYDIFNKVLSVTQYHHWNFTNSEKLLDKEFLTYLIKESVLEKYNSIDLQQSALLLSGGLDSTILAYELSKLGLKQTFTIAMSEQSVDYIAAQRVCNIFGLNFNPIIAKNLNLDCSIAITELFNRSIIEEMCCHMILSNYLRDLGIRIVFTGCGADELFIGYQHLLRYRNKDTRQQLQREFVSNYYRMDLRALIKYIC